MLHNVKITIKVFNFLENNLIINYELYNYNVYTCLTLKYYEFISINISKTILSNFSFFSINISTLFVKKKKRNLKILRKLSKFKFFND